jgi:hypothetical protein
LNFSSDVIKTGSAETKPKTETDCTEAEAEIKTDTPETKTETDTSRADTGRDQEYVVQGRTDHIRTYVQNKIQNLCIKIMHVITVSSQRTVGGAPRKEFNRKLRTSDQQNKNSSLDLMRHIKLNTRLGITLI